MSTVIATRRGPRWPKVPAGFVRAMLSGHSELGLVAGALIYLICLTGAIAVFVSELQVWEQPAAPVVSTGAPQAVDRAMRAGLAAVTKAPEDLYASFPTAPGQHLIITAYSPDHEEGWIADADGALAVKDSTPWSEFVGDLHMTLTIPSPWGITLVGIVGVALLSLLISGVLAHPRIFRDAFDFRFGGARRLREADLHNRLSVWALPFHVAVTLTGAFFGLSTLLIFLIAAVSYGGDTTKVTRPLYGPEVAPDAAAAPLPDIAALLEQSLAQQPGGVPTFVGVERPGTAGQSIMVEITVPGRLVRGERFYFDGAGKQLGVGGFSTGTAGLQAYSMAASLHFGTFGGIPVKLIYGVLGMALTVVSAGGMTIWLVRRRDQRRPAPRWEKIWAACVWGMPLAMALAALASQLAGLSPTLVFWLGSVVLVAASLLVRDGPTVSRRLRLALASGLVAMVIVELMQGGAAGFVGFPAGINIALLLTAGLIGAAVIAERRSARR